MLNPAAAWEFMKETSLVIAPRISVERGHKELSYEAY